MPLVFEYESAAQKILHETMLSIEDLDDIIDFICTVGNKRKIYFLWRPFLPDAGDDLVLELAVAAGCDSIITFNQKHFVGCDQLRIQVETPREFLERLGLLS